MKRCSLLIAWAVLLAASPSRGDDEAWTEFEMISRDLRNRKHFRQIASETLHPAALIRFSDRDPADVVLRRTEALLADLLKTEAAPSLKGPAKELARLKSMTAEIPVSDEPGRRNLFDALRSTRRKIAFANPLLDFDRILFLKRHRSIYNHMCDQYYGITAMPGGGLYVLKNPFGDAPTVRDLLAGSTVASGRLKGQALSGGPAEKRWNIKYDGMGTLKGEATEGGAFLSPDLSFDGKSILFAYVECTGERTHRHHTDSSRGHWDKGRCYHIFKADVDGKNLVQLTDGTWNDFDPCWLPNGRIAFISERRGGYLRCGRVCPTFTLYDMAADGSGINCLSFHETNEWHPSVTGDGRIVYTRWDYVDRHSSAAHHPWITTVEGTDSRALHGNFSQKKFRADMELDCRSVPGSHKIAAVAAPHHGQAFGSLILIDPHAPDDDALGPVKRITPEAHFPESQGHRGGQVYGTPWPLSETYYLCAYDARMRDEVGKQGNPFTRGNYGLYLVDAFGNRELLYRDPKIACMNPIPLRARPTPNPMPAPSLSGAPRRHAPSAPGDAGEAALLVQNVYASLLEWPEGTKIDAIRVWQVLPMTVPSHRPLVPHETGLRSKVAPLSVVPARWVLGTAPVEADGSAFFKVPANVELFFQALDERGLAVQSMRSATYLRDGETLSCQGCHEPKSSAPVASPRPLLASARPPSELDPEPDGARPFSFPRLVQPVLDRNCVPCHEKNRPKAPNLKRDPIKRNWYASYNSLLPYAFTDHEHPQRTLPGRFGARASKLFKMLEAGHNDLKLSREDLRRITLWLDGTSMFYGVYEKEGGKLQLQGGIPEPTLQ
jgi:hypothetical protein